MDAWIRRPTSRLGRYRALAAAVAGLVVVLGTATSVLAVDTAVAIQNFAFAPQSVTVSVGDTVTWTNGDSAPHTATADDGSFDTGQLAQNASGDATFDTAGTFAYHCSVHPTMTGTVVVEAAAGGGGAPGATSAPAASTPPTDAAAADTPSNGGSAAAIAAVLAALAISLGFVYRRVTRRA